MNLSPFTKDFRGQEQFQWVLTDFFSAVDSLLTSAACILFIIQKHGFKKKHFPVFLSFQLCDSGNFIKKKTVRFFTDRICYFHFSWCFYFVFYFLVYLIIIEQFTQIIIILKNFNFEITYLLLIYTRLEAVKKYFRLCNGPNKKYRKNYRKKKSFKTYLTLVLVRCQAQKKYFRPHNRTNKENRKIFQKNKKSKFEKRRKVVLF